MWFFAVDIYDDPTGDPMIFHGKTLTSKVSLRQVCEAIKKYGFVASPYPIIISAEVRLRPPCPCHESILMPFVMLRCTVDSRVRIELRRS